MMATWLHMQRFQSKLETNPERYIFGIRICGRCPLDYFIGSRLFQHVRPTKRLIPVNVLHFFPRGVIYTFRYNYTSATTRHAGKLSSYCRCLPGGPWAPGSLLGKFLASSGRMRRFRDASGVMRKSQRVGEIGSEPSSFAS